MTYEESDDDIEHDAGGARASGTVSVPDDVLITCGCHFHWQCLLDGYNMSLWQCPSCFKEVSSTSPRGRVQVLCNLKNEGGLQEGLDILPQLMEDAYLRGLPEETRARAFLEFCRQGDVEAIVQLMREQQHEDDRQSEEDCRTRTERKVDLLRYHDLLHDNQTGLHAAIVKGSREVVWLLLWLGSNLAMDEFPQEVLSEAQATGLRRGDMTSKEDIRTLTDARERTAEVLSAEVRGIWTDWLGPQSPLRAER